MNKYLIGFLLLIFLIACNRNPVNKDISVKQESKILKGQEFSFNDATQKDIIIATLRNCCGSEKEINETFKTPVLQEQNETYFDFFFEPKNNDKDLLLPGFSIYIEKSVVRGDINADGIDDCIVNVSAASALGGNYTTYHFVIFEGKEGKYVIDKAYDYTNIKFKPNSQADDFLKIRKIKKGLIFGTYKGFKTDDPHCCPSLVYLIVFKYDRNKISIISNKVVKESNEQI